MKTIKIFLASSEELKQERLELTDMVAHLNHTLKNRDIVVELVKWEHLDSSMGPLNKQDEYNNELRDCDLCLVLYWTRFGKYTRAELDVAYRELCAGRNPQKIYVYFKNSAEISPELQQFRDEFPQHYGHFFCNFENVDTLKADFLLQFLDYLSKNHDATNLVEIRDSQVIVGDKVYADITKVPFAGNNDEYNLLLKNIKKTQKLLAVTETDDPDYSECAQELLELLKKQQAMEDSLWDTALMITKLSTQKCSERLSRAIELFNQGDNKGANAILNEQDIERDIRQNLNLIELGKEGQKGLKHNIQEYELKVKTVKSEMADGWRNELCRLHERIIKLNETLFGESSIEVATALTDAGSTYFLLRLDKQNLECNLRTLDIRIKLLGEQHPDTATSYNNVGCAYGFLGNHKKALDNKLKSLSIQQSRLGELHPQTATTYNDLGWTYLELKDDVRSNECLQKALAIRRFVLGDNHSDTAATYNDIGCSYIKLHDYEKAIESLLRALKIRIEVLGERHPDTLSTMNNIGVAYSFSNNYRKSIEYSLKALDGFISLFGEYHADVAVAYHNVSSAYAALGEKNKAIKCIEKALEIGKLVHGYAHPYTIKYFFKASIRNAEIGNIEEAKRYLFELIENADQTIYQNAEFNKGISICYRELGDFDKALEYARKALELSIQEFGEQHLEVARCHNSVGLASRALNRLDEALQHFQAAFEIRKHLLPPDDEEFKKSESYIQETLQQFENNNYKK